MLKLANSFYRYLVFTCDKVNKTHVRRHSHLNCKRKTCGTVCVDIKLTAQFHSSLQLRQHAHGKKRLKIKPNTCMANNKMADRWKPFGSHACYGGQFDVAVDNNHQWKTLAQEMASSLSASKRYAHEIPTDYRMWEPIKGAKCSNNGPTIKFKVLSYNLLAQYLLECHAYLYKNCSPQDLTWANRSERLFDEIVSLSPDILCFQEVQVNHLNRFFLRFEQMGYTKLFKKKTGKGRDGCAIFFRSSMFHLVWHETVEFCQSELPILSRDNVGLIALLVPHELPNAAVVVATTHLLYNPKRTDVRLAQMRVFLAELDRLASYRNGNEVAYLPVILTGDFNSQPQSSVLRLLDTGYVSIHHYHDRSDWRRIGVTDDCQHLSVYLNRLDGRDPSPGIKLYNSDSGDEPPLHHSGATLVDQFSTMFNGSDITQPFELLSVYDSNNVATAYQDGWVTVDYIYYSYRGPLKLVGYLRLPHRSERAVMGCLPNEVYGSDHLALGAHFELGPYQNVPLCM